MMKNLVIGKIRDTPIEKQKIEIVERKGLGHPDYIADSIAEAFSRSLSKYYLDKFGRIMHHNVDKLEVIGGRATPEFNGGKILEPISILFSGRATDSVEGSLVPLKDIAEKAAKDWINDNIANLNTDSIDFIFKTKSGAGNLTDSFYRKGGVSSNDTSFGVGYSPLSETENLVLSMEHFLNAKEFKTSYKFSGEDVKVMAVRKGKMINVTVAMAFVDKYVSSVSDYFDKKAHILNILQDKFKETESGRKVKITLNGMDKHGRKKDGCYLTVTGTSSEQGDDGAVGRGNRVNGIITPNRTMSLEAAAGKNPVSHVGKIYSLLAFRLADEIHKSLDIGANIKLVGKIGTPLSEPMMAAIDLSRKLTADEKKKVNDIIENGFGNIEVITQDLLNEKLKIC